MLKITCHLVLAKIIGINVEIPQKTLRGQENKSVHTKKSRSVSLLLTHIYNPFIYSLVRISRDSAHILSI